MLYAQKVINYHYKQYVLNLNDSENVFNRPANILVAHLSSVVIGFTIVFYVYLLEKSNFISLTAPGICNVLAFLRSKLTMFGIYYLIHLIMSF